MKELKVGERIVLEVKENVFLVKAASSQRKGMLAQTTAMIAQMARM